jgi:hypothetical protein
LAGLKNGRLLDAAESLSFNVVIAVDRNMPDRQNFAARKVSVLILCAPTNRLSDLLPLVPLALQTLNSILPGEVARVR